MTEFDNLYRIFSDLQDDKNMHHLIYLLITRHDGYNYENLANYLSSRVRYVITIVDSKNKIIFDSERSFHDPIIHSISCNNEMALSHQNDNTEKKDLFTMMKSKRIVYFFGKRCGQYNDHKNYYQLMKAFKNSNITYIIHIVDRLNTLGGYNIIYDNIVKPCKNKKTLQFPKFGTFIVTKRHNEHCIDDGFWLFNENCYLDANYA